MCQHIQLFLQLGGLYNSAQSHRGMYDKLSKLLSFIKSAVLFVLKWTVKGFAWALWLFLVVNVVLQFPPLQRWAAAYLVNAASERAGTEVKIEGFYLGFFNRLVINGLYVKDYEADTLLYARKLEATVAPNPVILLQSGLNIQEITLREAQFNLRQLKQQDKLNATLFFERLFPPSTDTSAAQPFTLYLRKLHLYDVHFKKEDMIAGNRLLVDLEEGHVRLGKIALPNQIDIQDISLSGPRVRVEDHPSQQTYVQVAEQTEEIFEEEPAEPGGPVFTVARFLLEDGRFSLHNIRKSPVKTTPADELDYQHMEVFGIQIGINNFKFSDQVFQGQIDRIALRDSSGFVLERLAADEAKVSPKGVELNCFELVTPYTYLGDTLALRYRNYSDFETFVDDVRIDGRLHNSFVALRDIMVFAPALKQNAFFSNSRNTTLRCRGAVRGEVNNLRARDLFIELDDGSVLKGNFSSRNLAVKNEEFVSLRLEQFNTRMQTLRELIPGFNPPDNFNRLGALKFNGSFDGFFADFVAFGDLNTDIGRAVLDMRMNLKPGRAKASYSGRLSLIDFNLGKWSGNNDFGIVNFTSEVKNGIGLTGATANAELAANIQSFIFKGYNYQNAVLTGKLNKSLFDGDFVIQDDNIDFSFIGELNFSDTVPSYDFDAVVNHLDLKALNLSEEDLLLAGNVALNLRGGGNNRQMDGQARVSDLLLSHNEFDSYKIDSIVASSTLNSDGERIFSVRSDIMQADIEGRFEIDKIPQYFFQYIRRNFPGFGQRLGIKEAKWNTQKQAQEYFSYQLSIFDSKGLNWLVSGKLGILKDVQLQGYYNRPRDSLTLDLEAPHLQYDNIDLANILVLFNGQQEVGNLNLIIDSTYLNGKHFLPTLTMMNQIDGDTMSFGINYLESSFGILDKLNLNGTLFLVDSSRYEIRFNQSDLVILNDIWQINESNYITFGKKYFDTQDFQLINKDRRVVMQKTGANGMQLDLFNFDFHFIDTYWDYDQLDFSGRFSARVNIGQVFDFSQIQADITADSFFINNDYYGQLKLSAAVPDLKSKLQAQLDIKKDTSQLTAQATYNLADLERVRTTRTPADLLAQYFDLGIKVKGYPLRFAQYFLGSAVSDIVGSFGANLHIYGMPARPEVEGYINAVNGGVTIDYLKTRYHFDRSYIKAGNYLFDASGTILRDKYGHRASIYGGISHNRLKDLGVKARLRTDRFLALDTKKGDNKVFYGQALGAGEIRFSGPFDQVNIYVNATVGDSSKLVIPVSSEREASELNVRFVNKHQKTRTRQTQEDRPVTLEGVDLEMDLSIREEAQMELVFNEQTGDIIRGSGRGNIRILVPRGGDFQMYGDYTISRGNYLFTLYNVVNKDFRIKPGGVIQWSGDPFGAQIRLEAEYKDLKTSLANFIQEYLLNSEASVKNDASKSTNVVLSLELQGELLRPQISFDISFPALTGQLQTYTESKLRLLKQDQNELNRQVFGLIVIGQFLPADLSFSGTDIIYNTVSEFVSNQLSLLVTELLSEAVGEESVLSGMDFDIAYNQYRNVNLGEGQDFTGGDEFQVTISQNFLNDRLSIQVGGNVDFGSSIRATPEANGTFIGNDVVIEYVLNTNRTLKLRLYQRLQPDIGGGRRLEVGTGLSYRKEFDSFSDFLAGFKQSAKKLKNNGS